MSALEQALRQIIREELASFAGNAGAQQQAPVQQAPVQQAPAPAPVDPFGGLGGTAAPAPAPEVTAAMVQNLIMPHVSNDAIKSQLSAEMAAMGIQELGQTRADQLPELYARFQRVITGANSALGQQAPAPSGGII